MGKLLGRLPAGMRDLLPAEAKRKRRLEETFGQLVERWGYSEVVTPTCEYFVNLAPGNETDDKLYKFLDRQGNLMALRPDMTRSIARLVATGSLGQENYPLRLYYLSHAFNYQEPLLGRQREVFQAGVEILGAAQPTADAEAVALAVEAMQACGLQDFRVSLGHVGIFHSLMDALNLPPDQVAAVQQAVGNKDFVQLQEQLAATDLPSTEQDQVNRLLSLRGGPEVLDQAAEILHSGTTLQALANLRQVYQTLISYGVEEYVTLDLGLLLKLDYYTGVVFEGYTLALGAPLCGGGRYDQLVSQFGIDLPATGFALSVDQLLAALEKQQGPALQWSPDLLVAWEENYVAQAVGKVQELRSKGLRAVLDLAASDLARAHQQLSPQLARVLFIDGDGWHEFNR